MKKILCRLLTVALIAAAVMGLVGCGSDYVFFGEDMNTYVTWDQKKFQNIKVELDEKYNVGDEEVDAAIKEELFSHRDYANNGRLETSGVISYGDAAKLWYSGVVDLGDGKTETIRDAASEGIYSTDPFSYVLGDETIRIPELEKALEGIKAEDYRTETEGTVKTSDKTVYFLTYRTYNDGVQGAGSPHVMRVEAAKLDEVFTAGFKAKFDSEVVGKTFNDANRYFDIVMDNVEGATSRKYSIRLLAQTDSEISVEGTFRDDGGKHAGKSVTLTVQLFGFIDYIVPELNAETAVSIFKIDSTAKDPVAECRKQIKKELLDDDERIGVLQNAIWAELKKCITVKEIPSSKVSEMEDIFMDTVESYYNEAQEMTGDARKEFIEKYGEGAMQDIDHFAVALFSGNPGESAEEICRQKAENWVKEDMVVFAVVQFSGLEMPNEEKTNTEVDKMVASVVEQTGYEEEQVYDMYGGREYFVAAFYRNTFLEMLEDKVTIGYKTPVDK